MRENPHPISIKSTVSQSPIRFPICLLLLPAIAAAGSPPDAGDLLDHVAATYQNLKSYKFELREISRGAGPDVTLAAIPGKFYAKIDGTWSYGSPYDSGSYSNALGYRCITDGKTTWTYNTRAKQFAIKDAAPFDITRNKQDICERDIAAVRNAIVERWKNLDGWARFAAIARADSFKLGHSNVKCWVVAIHPIDGSQVELWIDQERYLVLRESYSSKSEKLKLRRDLIQAHIRTPPDPKLFVFTTPRHWRETNDALAAQNRELLLNAPAPDFKFSDATHVETTLAGLRGQVVILYFWATWTPHAADQTAVMEDVWDRRRSQGVQLIGISYESHRDVDGFLHDNVAGFLRDNKARFPNYSDTSRKLHDAYGIAVLPTIIIVDRQGIIRSYIVDGDPLDSAVDLDDILTRNPV